MGGLYQVDVTLIATVEADDEEKAKQFAEQYAKAVIDKVFTSRWVKAHDFEVKSNGLMWEYP